MSDMTQYTQANSFITIDTPLSKDKLLLTEFGCVDKHELKEERGEYLLVAVTHIAYPTPTLTMRP